MPKITVILTSYNHEKYIRASIDSVLAQTFTDFELIIIDDASTDSSWGIISEYNDSRISKCQNSVNTWFVGGVNEVISNRAKGEYIAIHHSDDVWEPEKLQKQIDYLDKNPECGAVFTDALIIGESGEAFLDESNFYYSVFQQPNRSRYEWLNFFFNKGNVLCHPSVLIRKHSYDVCGMYRYGLVQMVDLDMWVRLCLHFEIYILPEKLVRFRVREDKNNTSSDTVENRSRMFYEYYSILKNYQKISSDNVLLSIFPNSKKYLCDDELGIQFALAMILIENGSYVFSKFLGFEMLFELLRDEERAKKIMSNDAFDYSQYIELTAVYGVPNITVSQYERELQLRDEKIALFSNAYLEKDAAIKEKNTAILEKNATIEERNAAIKERNAAIKERNAAIEERNTAKLERDAAIEERNTASKNLNTVYSSFSWTITKPLRLLMSKLKALQ